MKDKRMILSIIWVVIGIALINLEFAKIVDDFWGGMGFAFVFVGVLQLIRYYRSSKNEEYREKMKIAESDERNHFIRNKTWAWTGYIFILTAAVLSIVFRIIGQDLLSTASSMAICFMLLLYWIIYAVLKRKY